MTIHTHAQPHEHAPVAPNAGRGWLRLALWLSLSALALWVLLHGQTNRYIAPNVAWTLWLAIIVSLALAGVEGYGLWHRSERLGQALHRLRRWQRGDWRSATYAIPFLPFVLGIVVAPAVLGADSILANDGVVTMVPAPSQLAVHTPFPITMSLLQLQDELRTGAPFLGDVVKVTGFALHQRGLPANEWLLTRFITPHCVAEAQPIALLVRMPTGRAPPNNTWVTLTGPLAAGTLNGHAVALLAPQAVQRIGTPRDPYLIY
jgi:uncharacterized repeat protein (TIGR03943 family)